ncbi:protease inhibitor Inh/omp19 family protein [Xanthobacter sp. DSM 24535]|uniref:protease inhibitor Inh/omp19 family protein n=1 Tax=Roseixanthobacter psychrophilus TaxID=3119917 RepID=UPI00372ADE22
MKFMSASAVFASALLLGGCSTELDGFGTKTSAVDSNRVLSAPTASVESAPMPAPSTTGSTAAAARPSGANATTAAAAVTPSAAATASSVPLTPPPVNPGGTAYAASNEQEQLAGAWTFAWDDGQHTCPVTLSTVRGASGLAAQADISCPSEIFMTKGWDVMGADIVLQNHVGKITARLQPSGANRYVGVISDNNQAIALTR